MQDGAVRALGECSLTKGVFVSGHFGELLQGKLGSGGPVVLVTLPCNQVGVRIRSTVKSKPLPPPYPDFFERLGVSASGFHAETTCEPGLGTGASTARLVAAARFAGWSGPHEDLAKACLAVEGATDPLMFLQPETVLWASRQAAVMGRVPVLPSFEIVGGFWGPPTYTDPTDETYPDISDLVAEWQKGGSREFLAKLASESAARTLKMRGAVADPTEDLADELGALGWQIAHSGAARGLLFEPGKIPNETEQVMKARGLRQIIRFQVGKA